MPPQAQANVIHYESRRAGRALVQLGVESSTRTAPPSAPASGARFIVPPDASGAWRATHVNEISLFTDEGWLICHPAPAGGVT